MLPPRRLTVEIPKIPGDGRRTVAWTFDLERYGGDECRLRIASPRSQAYIEYATPEVLDTLADFLADALGRQRALPAPAVVAPVAQDLPGILDDTDEGAIRRALVRQVVIENAIEDYKLAWAFDRDATDRSPRARLAVDDIVVTVTEYDGVFAICGVDGAVLGCALSFKNAVLRASEIVIGWLDKRGADAKRRLDGE